jgi:hypothetical protein
MDNKVNTKILMFGAWSALFYPGLIIIGWLFMAGFVPPPPATAKSADIVALFQGNLAGIRAGMVVTMFGAMMYMPLGATVSYFISRIEGFFGPLSVLQLMGAVGAAVLTFYPPMWWLIAAFRPERPPEITLMLSDTAWLQWVGGLTIYYPAILTVGIAAFMDKSREPAFPRWFGYVSLWMAMLLLPGQCIFFFKTGVFAWDGLFSFWLAFAAFGAWFPIAFWLLRRAVLRLESREASLSAVAAHQPI